MQYRKSDFCEHQIAFKFVNSTKVLWKVLKLQWVFSEGAEQSGIYSKKKLNTLGKRQNNTPRELKNCLCPYITKTLKAIMHGMLGQDHGLATAHFSVESGCDPPESQQNIVLSQCSRFSPFPKDTEDSQSWGFWVGSDFMKQQQLLQEQGDPRSWEKQVTPKAPLKAC